MAQPSKRKRAACLATCSAPCHSGSLGEFASTLHALCNGARVDTHPACGWVHEHAATGTALDAVALGALLGQLSVLEQLHVLSWTEPVEQLMLPSFGDMRGMYATEAGRLVSRGVEVPATLEAALVAHTYATPQLAHNRDRCASRAPSEGAAGHEACEADDSGHAGRRADAATPPRRDAAATSALRTALAFARSEADDARGELKGVRAELRSARASLTEADAELVAARDELEAVRDELRQLKAPRARCVAGTQTVGALRAGNSAVWAQAAAQLRARACGVRLSSGPVCRSGGAMAPGACDSGAETAEGTGDASTGGASAGLRVCTPAQVEQARALPDGAGSTSALAPPEARGVAAAQHTAAPCTAARLEAASLGGASSGLSAAVRQLGHATHIRDVLARADHIVGTFSSLAALAAGAPAAPSVPADALAELTPWAYHVASEGGSATAAAAEAADAARALEKASAAEIAARQTFIEVDETLWELQKALRAAEDERGSAHAALRARKVTHAAATTAAARAAAESARRRASLATAARTFLELRAAVAQLLGDAARAADEAGADVAVLDANRQPAN